MSRSYNERNVVVCVCIGDNGGTGDAGEDRLRNFRGRTSETRVKVRVRQK